jgi:hypothetical protein
MKDEEIVNEKFCSFLVCFLRDVVGTLAHRLGEILDPFEKFVILKKLERFVAALDKGAIETFVEEIVIVLQYEDICTLLGYADTAELSKAIQKVYFRVDIERKGVLLDVIHRLKLVEAQSFLRELMGQYNPPNLQKKIQHVFNVIVRM